MEEELNHLLCADCAYNGNGMLIFCKYLTRDEINRVFDLVSLLNLEYSEIYFRCKQPLTSTLLIAMGRYISRPGNKVRCIYADFRIVYNSYVTKQFFKFAKDMFINEHNNVIYAEMGFPVSPFFCNLMLIREVTCMLSARVINRIGNRSALKRLPPEMFRLVSDFLVKDQDAIDNEEERIDRYIEMMTHEEEEEEEEEEE